MRDEDKTKGELVVELTELRQRVAELETSEAELRRVEVALQREKAYLEGLFGSAQEGIVMCDNHGRVMRINSEFTSIFGYTPDEVIGWSIDDLIAPENLINEALTVTKDVTERLTRVAFESHRRRKDGALIYVSGLVAPVVINDEQVGGYGIYRDITERKRAEEELQHSFEEMKRILEQTVNALASAAEARDYYTAGHQTRVADLAHAIAREMELSEEQSSGIRMVALIHDIGKIYIPSEILSKPEQLTDIEYDIIKTHPHVGYDILKDIEFPCPIAQIVLQHHERQDGSGYPHGLSGDEILLGARILAVADVVETMASRRPYRPAHGIDKALEEISQNRGVLYDPEIVDTCLRLFTEKKFQFR